MDQSQPQPQHRAKQKYRPQGSVESGMIDAGAGAQLEAIEGELAPSQGLPVLPAGHAEQLAGELPREAAKSGVEVEVEVGAVAVPI